MEGIGEAKGEGGKGGGDAEGKGGGETEGPTTTEGERRGGKGMGGRRDEREGVCRTDVEMLP